VVSKRAFEESARLGWPSESQFVFSLEKALSKVKQLTQTLKLSKEYVDLIKERE
jgi:hypothetical protein